MPVQNCACGAQYKIAESSFGKKATCRKCGAIMLLGQAPIRDQTPSPQDEGMIPLADDDGLMDEFAEAAERAQAASATSSRPADRTDDAPDVSRAILRNEGDPSTGSMSGFVYAVLKSFAFPLSLNGLMTLLAIWIFVVLSSYVGFISLIVSGWFAAYLFDVIGSAANGDEDLPGMGFRDGWWDGIIAPLLYWLATWGIVMLPAFVYLVAVAGSGAVGGAGAASQIVSGMQGELSETPDLIFVTLSVAGMFLWPIVALCVSLGGLSSLTRIDLILITVSRTFPAYILVNVCLFGSMVIGKFAFQGDSFWVGVLATGFGIYAQLVSMRAIGLYYHHYKDRFAWNWG